MMVCSSNSPNGLEASGIPRGSSGTAGLDHSSIERREIDMRISQPSGACCTYLHRREAAGLFRPSISSSPRMVCRTRSARLITVDVRISNIGDFDSRALRLAHPRGAYSAMPVIWTAFSVSRQPWKKSQSSLRRKFRLRPK